MSTVYSMPSFRSRLRADLDDSLRRRPGSSAASASARAPASARSMSLFASAPAMQHANTSSIENTERGVALAAAWHDIGSGSPKPPPRTLPPCQQLRTRPRRRSPRSPRCARLRRAAHHAASSADIDHLGTREQAGRAPTLLTPNPRASIACEPNPSTIGRAQRTHASCDIHHDQPPLSTSRFDLVIAAGEHAHDHGLHGRGRRPRWDRCGEGRAR